MSYKKMMKSIINFKNEVLKYKKVVGEASLMIQREQNKNGYINPYFKRIYVEKDILKKLNEKK